jgi:hypothetical protein
MTSEGSRQFWSLNPYDGPYLIAQSIGKKTIMGFKPDDLAFMSTCMHGAVLYLVT